VLPHCQVLFAPPACDLHRAGLATRIMKLACLSFLLSICLFLPAHADLTIMEKVEGGGQSGDVTVKIKGDKERVESPSAPTTIIDGKTGEMDTLMNDQKTFVHISADKMKAAAEMMTKFNGNDKSAEKPKLTPTGRKETVNGIETDEYVYEMPQAKTAFWVATKYPDAGEILKQMQAPITGAWKVSKIGMPDYTELPGVPLKTVISIGSNQITTTVKSIKQDQLSDADFAVPKDFQEMKAPAARVPPPMESNPPAATSSASP
jgi:hypothetical protein